MLKATILTILSSLVVFAPPTASIIHEGGGFGGFSNVSLAPVTPVTSTKTELTGVYKILPNKPGVNDYTYGYCTWWVAKQRYVPPGWGNAINWLSRARLQGYETSTTPRTGAIAWKQTKAPGHVVYVTSVNPDGTFNFSAMNEAGWNKVNYGTRSSVGWVFIY